MAQHLGQGFDVHAILQCQRGESVPEVMEPNLIHPILLNKPTEMLRNIIRPNKSSTLINTDVVEVIATVGFLEESAMH